MEIEIKTTLRIGVDMGGVCVHKAKDYENSDNDFDGTINMEGCVEAIRKLRAEGHYIVLVSFCGYARAVDTNERLKKDYSDLFDEVWFVKKRHFKHNIAVKRGLDVMIDDNMDILIKMSTVHRIHFTADVPDCQLDKLEDAHRAKNWTEVLLLLKRLEPKGHAPVEMDVSTMIYDTSKPRKVVEQQKKKRRGKPK